MTIPPYHLEQIDIAAQLYRGGMLAEVGRQEWLAEKRAAARRTFDALRRTDYLRDIPQGLMDGGAATLVLRFLSAPPISQDQFRHVASRYSKASEKNDSGLSGQDAANVSEAFAAWRDPELTRWLDTGRAPRPSEIKRLIGNVTPLIAQQQLATRKRASGSKGQEDSIQERLLSLGWEIKSGGTVTQTTLGYKKFMRKARFATADDRRGKEVDIAFGLGRMRVLAAECKIANDETNSTRRADEAINKSNELRDHWGRGFIVPAAILQGVWARRKVADILDAGLLIFWSHDLNDLEQWLVGNSAEG